VRTHYINSLQDFIDQGVYITDEQIREKELSAQIEKEILCLPQKMREVFELSRNTDMSYKKIGQQLHISDKTVKKQVGNAVKILRLKLGTAIFLILIVSLL
jgi:RNA polymerase sigma-70 factor (ECF subfamily)